MEKRLALLRSAAVQLASPLPGASLKTADPVQLELDRARLQEQIKQHSAQVLSSCTYLAAVDGAILHAPWELQEVIVQVLPAVLMAYRAVLNSARAAASAEQRMALGWALWYSGFLLS